MIFFQQNFPAAELNRIRIGILNAQTFRSVDRIGRIGNGIAENGILSGDSEAAE